MDATNRPPNHSSNMAFVEQMRSLRLLPPPANELVPLFLTIATFAISTLIFGGNDSFANQWASFINSLVAFLRDEGKGDAKKSVLCHDPVGALWIYGSFLIHMVMYWGYSITMHTAEHIFPSFMKHFKIQPTKFTGWSDVIKMAPQVIFNQTFLGLPMLALSYKFITWREGGLEQVMPLTLEVPSVGRFVFLFVTQVIITEIWFYCAHRLLHDNKWLFTNVHSKHHSYHSPSCLESVYVHPIEYILNSFMCLLVAPIVTLKSPLLVFWMWMWMVTFLQVHDHSGYWLPFVPKVLMHDYHHQRVNCCYGILGLMDSIFNTKGGLDEFVMQHEELTSLSKDTKQS